MKTVWVSSRCIGSGAPYWTSSTRRWWMDEASLPVQILINESLCLWAMMLSWADAVKREFLRAINKKWIISHLDCVFQECFLPWRYQLCSAIMLFAMPPWLWFVVMVELSCDWCGGILRSSNFKTFSLKIYNSNFLMAYFQWIPSPRINSYICEEFQIFVY